MRRTTHAWLTPMEGPGLPWQRPYAEWTVDELARGLRVCDVAGMSNSAEAIQRALDGKETK